MSTEIIEKEFDVLPEFSNVWKTAISDFEKIYNPEEHASPFLSLVDMIMTKCQEKDESEYKLFEYIDYTNALLKKEPKGKIINILIEDGLDFVDPE
jgi:hypothetical protein